MFYGMIEFLKETLDISTIMFFCFTGSLYYAFLYASIRAIMDVVFIRMPSPHAKLQAEASVQLDLHLSKGFYYSCTLRKMVIISSNFHLNFGAKNSVMLLKWDFSWDFPPLCTKDPRLLCISWEFLPDHNGVTILPKNTGQYQKNQGDWFSPTNGPKTSPSYPM